MTTNILLILTHQYSLSLKEVNLSDNAVREQRTANVVSKTQSPKEYKKGRLKFSLPFVRMIGVEPTRREALAPETSVSTISPHPHRCWDCKDIKCFLISNIDSHLIEQYYTHLTYPILQSESLQKKDYNPIPPLHLPKMAKSSHILPYPDIPLLQISSDEAHHHPPPA